MSEAQDPPLRQTTTVKEEAKVINVKGFLIWVKVLKGLGVISALFVVAMAVVLSVAIISAGPSRISTGVAASVVFAQIFNVIFCVLIILGLLGVPLLIRYIRFLRYWAGVGLTAVYTGFQLFSYTQTSLSLLGATGGGSNPLNNTGILQYITELSTAANVASFILMGVGGVFFLMAVMCLQRLENAAVVSVQRTTVRDYAKGTKSESVHLDKMLLENERGGETL